jgi:glycosyltransferase involved in cell wall biosynthesis
VSELAISAIVPVYNGMGFLEKSLPPLLRLHESGELIEVIVADDGSTDGSGDWARERGARVLSTGGREGPARARNLATQSAKGDVVWFVDADVVAHEDGVEPLRRAFDDPGVVAVFGSYDDTPPYEGFASQYMNLRHHFVHHQHEGEASTFWSGCGAVRRKAFLGVGGFDAERYRRPSIEDIELGYRLRAQTGRIRTDPTLQGTHLKEWSLWGVVHTDITCRAIPWSRLLLETPDAPMDLNTGSSEQLKAVLAGLLLLSVPAALFGWVSPWLAVGLFVAVWVANRALFEVFRKRRGLFFGLGALLFHQVHLVYSAATYVLCWFEHHLTGGRGRRAGESSS